MGCRGSYVASLYVAKGSSKGRYEIFFGICFVYLKKICSKIRRKKKKTYGIDGMPLGYQIFMLQDVAGEKRG
jgi:hypothetical protein